MLQAVRLPEILRPYGELAPTGSYYLDTMVYPDIDLLIPKVSIEELFAIGGQLACSELVFQVVFEKSTDDSLPGGLYLKPRIAYGSWGRPWKIDIWSVEETVIERKMEPMRHYREQMTPELRELIVRYKLSILTPDLRTPMYSGIYIYQAMIDEGLRDFARVSQYLREHGIKLE